MFDGNFPLLSSQDFIGGKIRHPAKHLLPLTSVVWAGHFDLPADSHGGLAIRDGVPMTLPPPPAQEVGVSQIGEERQAIARK